MYVRIKTYSQSSSSGTIKFLGGSMEKDKYCVEIGKSAQICYLWKYIWRVKKNGVFVTLGIPYKKYGNCRNAAKKFADDMGIRLIDKERK